MADPFVGEIRVFPYNFAPTGWALCNGQLLPISQNTALFSLLGTMYGGDGRTTFGLPNLQGAVPIHAGQGPGLTARQVGETGGSATVTLLPTQVAAHTHAVAVASNDDLGAASRSPDATTVFGKEQARSTSAGYVTVGAQAAVALNAAAVLPAGGGAPHNNLAPYLSFNFCIALQGIFPPRA
jgi:microcystin-dependent protein